MRVRSIYMEGNIRIKEKGAYLTGFVHKYASRNKAFPTQRWRESNLVREHAWVGGTAARRRVDASVETLA